MMDIIDSYILEVCTSTVNRSLIDLVRSTDFRQATMWGKAVVFVEELCAQGNSCVVSDSMKKTALFVRQGPDSASL